MANALQNVFTNIADAIRGKTGETGKISPSVMAVKISNLNTDGISCKTLRYYRGRVSIVEGVSAFTPDAEIAPKTHAKSFYIQGNTEGYDYVGCTTKLNIGTAYPLTQFGYLLG